MAIAEIRASVDQTYQDNRALIAGLQPTDFDRPTSNPKWHVRQLAAHIAEDEGGAMYIGKLLARGKNAKAPGFVVNLANWWGVRKHSKAGSAELLTVMDGKHSALISWLESLPEEALAQGGDISQMGHLTLGEFLIKNGDHSREHGAEIRAALSTAR